MIRALAAIAALALVACGHIETHEVVLRADTSGAAKDPDVYLEGRAPPRAFYEVALLQVVGFGSNANPDDVVLGLVARGRLIGCDAIVRARVDQGSSRASGFGVCVRWSPSDAPAPAGPAPAPPPSPHAPAAPPPVAPPAPAPPTDM